MKNIFVHPEPLWMICPCVAFDEEFFGPWTPSRDLFERCYFHRCWDQCRWRATTGILFLTIHVNPMYNLKGFSLEENLKDLECVHALKGVLPSPGISKKQNSQEFPMFFLGFEAEIVSTAPTEAWIPRWAHEAAHEGVEGQNWLEVWTKTWRKKMKKNIVKLPHSCIQAILGFPILFLSSFWLSGALE